MILISHRGNTTEKIPDLENNPSYIDAAIELGFDVEVDIRKIDDKIYLGHDSPDHLVDLNWLMDRRSKLWVHCKNILALEWFDSLSEFNYFWHDTDTVTITSQRYLWAYPGKQPIKNSVAVMPEIFNDDLTLCLGICSDYIAKYKR